MLSEFYQLRRTAIKDIAAYLGFLGGFIGSAPFAWGLLATQLESGSFVRGLWYFFGIVTMSGIVAGIAGLALGHAAGLVWEQVHRHSRRDRASLAATQPAPAPAAAVAQTPPRLQLVTPAEPAPAPAHAPSRREGARSLRVPSPADPGATAAILRDLLLFVIVIGMAGLIAELVLLEHTESVSQWIPLAALGAGLAACLAVRMRPSRATVFAFRGMMVALVGVGLLGLYYHYTGNVEFALERTPGQRGPALVWEALTGATPALAPGAMVQLGLLGLVYAWRHPAAAVQAGGA